MIKPLNFFQRFFRFYTCFSSSANHIIKPPLVKTAGVLL